MLGIRKLISADKISTETDSMWKNYVPLLFLVKIGEKVEVPTLFFGRSTGSGIPVNRNPFGPLTILLEFLSRGQVFETLDSPFRTYSVIDELYDLNLNGNTGSFNVNMITYPDRTACFDRLLVNLYAALVTGC